MEYFFSFAFIAKSGHGSGDVVLSLDEPVHSPDVIHQVRDRIKAKISQDESVRSVKQVTILHWQRLEQKPEPVLATQTEVANV